MTTKTVKMSSRGQVVIPQDIREELDIHEGSVFAVIGTKNSVILKKIETPSNEDLIKELEIIAREGKKRAEKLGIKQSDVPNLINKIRKEKRR